jgi:hypothetical protein
MSCCFFISATEIDIGNSHQTFFDDYDTYLPADQQDFQVNEGQVFLQKDGLILPNLFMAVQYQLFLDGGYSYAFSNFQRFLTGRRKIFLDNSSLLI